MKFQITQALTGVVEFVLPVFHSDYKRILVLVPRMTMKINFFFPQEKD